MTRRIYNSTAQASCDGMVDQVDAGAGAGTVQIRTGAQPAVNGALSGTLLVTFTMSDPAFGAASASGSGATATAASLPKTATAAATGTAGYGAVLDSNSNVLWTGTVATSAADFIIDNTSINSGQTVNLTAFTVTTAQT